MMGRTSNDDDWTVPWLCVPGGVLLRLDALWLKKVKKEKRTLRVTQRGSRSECREIGIFRLCRVAGL